MQTELEVIRNKKKKQEQSNSFSGRTLSPVGTSYFKYNICVFNNMISQAAFPSTPPKKKNTERLMNDRMNGAWSKSQFCLLDYHQLD